jgi:hypothetical protein
VLYPHPRGPPRKQSLKWLASTYLGRTIQAGEARAAHAEQAGPQSPRALGHCSAEDAVAALELAQLKIERGAHFGVSVPDSESLLDVLARARKNVYLLGRATTLRRVASSSSSVVAGETDAQVVAAAVKCVQGPVQLACVFLHDLFGALRKFYESPPSADPARLSSNSAGPADAKAGSGETGAGLRFGTPCPPRVYMPAPEALPPVENNSTQLNSNKSADPDLSTPLASETPGSINSSSSSSSMPEALRSALQAFDLHLERLFFALPANSLFMLVIVRL